MAAQALLPYTAPIGPPIILCGLINGLPTEILSLIFEHWLLGYRSIEPLHSSTPYTLAAVCQLWRLIALATPAIWSKLRVHLIRDREAKEGVYGLHSSLPVETRYREIPGGMIEEIPFWIERSKSLLMELYISIGSSFSRDLLLRTLWPCTERIGVLHIKASVVHVSSLAKLMQLKILPRLREVTLDFDAEDLGSDELQDILETCHVGINLAECSNLRSVQVISEEPLFSPTFSPLRIGLVTGIPYKQLTVLLIYEVGLSPTDAYEILSQGTSLISCNLHFGHWNTTEISSFTPKPVTLPNLLDFHVTFDIYRHSHPASRRISPFFVGLTVPALDSLCLCAPDATDSLILPVLVEMQRRSRAPLSVLHFQEVGLDHGELPPLLTLVPKLRRLKVEAPKNGCRYDYVEILAHLTHPYLQLALDMERSRDVHRFLLPELQEILITDNISQEYLDEDTGYLKKGATWQINDLSTELRDGVLLDFVRGRASNRDASIHADGILCNGVDENSAGKKVNKVTVNWRNVPEEWVNMERWLKREAWRTLTMYTSEVHFPLESAKPARDWWRHI